MLNTQYIRDLNVIKVWGKVTRIVGLVIEGYCPYASVGSLCEITQITGKERYFC